MDYIVQFSYFFFFNFHLVVDVPRFLPCLDYSIMLLGCYNSLCIIDVTFFTLVFVVFMKIRGFLNIKVVDHSTKLTLFQKNFWVVPNSFRLYYIIQQCNKTMERGLLLIDVCSNYFYTWMHLWILRIWIVGYFVAHEKKLTILRMNNKTLVLVVTGWLYIRIIFLYDILV